VATALDADSGSMFAAVLESAGIPSRSAELSSGWLCPREPGGFGCVDPHVPARFAADAAAILAELDVVG
jgi:hypothetical protein